MGRDESDSDDESYNQLLWRKRMMEEGVLRQWSHNQNQESLYLGDMHLLATQVCLNYLLIGKVYN